MCVKLDIRSKIILLLVANVLMFKKMSVYEHLFVATFFTFFIVLLFEYKSAIRIYSFYLLFTIYEIYFAKYVTLAVVDNFLLLSSLMFKTIYFPICSGIILVGSSKVSELITFLRSIKIPRSIIIVLAVIFRFFPAMATDYKLIKNSLKLKGIGVSNFYYFRHPIKFIEYVFVPYVIISTNIANDLSISCLCRGIDNNQNSTSIIKLSFRYQDYLFLGILSILVVYVGVRF
ncbi:energy-coupling factor transporter transmembrane protein EcfT [Gemella sp. GH3]|uniref:energy-coupling factor transporter transmembrane component T n=1 Tax=unclassified Gemella TaxID=2624949 RepID=UPI0015D0CE90|nr:MULTISPECIES: energy-coupling factor transporter transmembrane component T [unclassified Gemella]MBF0714147.1 energy-coupling factor transporter transmembrane protein EcfT [Gemella sp. GH3.1]NYS51099.1 energy-coupling factor transporter transmembrane protein EcfT [Gemella sp. GH3]